MRMLHVSAWQNVGIVLDLCCMQLHDLMYALHVVSMHLHNNKQAQNFCSYLGPYHPKYVLVLVSLSLIHYTSR